jgi:hypothetical protein
VHDLAQDSKIASRLLRRIKARNHELMVEIAIEAALGILFTVLTSVAVFAIAWFVGFSIGGFRFSASTVALGVTAIYLLVSVISAWRNVDPFAGLAPMSDADRMAFAVSGMVSGYVHFNRHSVAGLAAVLMGGPMNLVGALRNWLHRLPTDPRLIDQAAEILSACQPEVDLKKIRSSGAAAVLLRRLNLIVPSVDSTVVTLTEKGRDVVGQNQANPGQA